MAGNSNSGRPSNRSRAARVDLLTLTTNWLHDNFHTFDKDTKVKVALAIAPKGVADKHIHEGELNIKGLIESVENAPNT